MTIGAIMSAREQFLARLNERKNLIKIKTVAATTTTTTFTTTTTTTTTQSTTPPTTPAPATMYQTAKLINDAPVPTQPTRTRATRPRTFPTFSTIVVPNDEDDKLIKELICKF